MEVLFVHADEDVYSRERPLAGNLRMQFGIAYISAVLKEAGHTTRLVVPTPATLHKVDEYIRRYEPGLVCFSSVYAVFDFLSGVAHHVKKHYPDIFLLAGGTHVSLNPESCLESGAFDAVCVSEGEYPTLELVECLDAGREPTGIRNLYVRKEPGPGGIEKNETRPFIEDLDGLPFPDRAMWMPWFWNPLSTPSVLASRGCPFKCTYCCNHALAGLSEGKYVRVRSPENIVSEIEGLKDAVPGLVDILLEAENLGSKKDWAYELCDHFEQMNDSFEIPVRFCTNLRVTPRSDYDDFFAALARGGFGSVNIGLESGSERMRRDVLKRNYSNEDVLNAVRAAKKHGLKVGFYNLIGLPGETKDDFRETIAINRRCKPDYFLLSVFYPYPGTRLYDTCREMGLLDRMPDASLERRRPALDLPTLSKRAITRRMRWSPVLFHWGKRPWWELLWRVVLTKIFSNRRLLDAYRWVSIRVSPYRKFQKAPPP